MVWYGMVWMRGRGWGGKMRYLDHGDSIFAVEKSSDALVEELPHAGVDGLGAYPNEQDGFDDDGAESSVFLSRVGAGEGSAGQVQS